MLWLKILIVSFPFIVFTSYLIIILVDGIKERRRYIKHREIWRNELYKKYNEAKQRALKHRLAEDWLNKFLNNGGNMTNKELEYELKELKENLNESFKRVWEALDKLTPQHIEEVWTPKQNEEFWSYSLTGPIKHVAQNDEMTKSIIKLGNYYKTCEEAEYYYKKNIIINKYRKYIEERTKPLLWSSIMAPKYYASYNVRENKIQFEKALQIQTQGVIYASSPSILSDAIQFIGGEEVAKLYLFNAEKVCFSL